MHRLKRKMKISTTPPTPRPFEKTATSSQNLEISVTPNMNTQTAKSGAAPVTKKKPLTHSVGMETNHTDEKLTRLNRNMPTNTNTTENLSCELIPELPFPWNGAFLQWQKDLANEPR